MIHAVCALLPRRRVRRPDDPGSKASITRATDVRRRFWQSADSWLPICGAESAAPTASAQSGTQRDTPTAASTYRNGEYSATGDYQTPGGTQSIGVTLTLDNDVVTAVSLDRSQTRGTSAEFQEKFDSGIAAQVVGKNIDDLDVAKVAGSSLTSGGFNAAVDEIQSEARA